MRPKPRAGGHLRGASWFLLSRLAGCCLEVSDLCYQPSYQLSLPAPTHNSRCRLRYQFPPNSNGTLGRTGVCSFCTAWSWFGSRPRAFRIVGAICKVSTGVVTVLGSKLGFDSNNMTLTSSCAKPPCSASFFVLPE